MNLTSEFLSVLILVMGFSSSFGISQNSQNKCVEKKLHGMLNYICNEMKLEKIPAKIKSTIEVRNLKKN